MDGSTISETGFIATGPSKTRRGLSTATHDGVLFPLGIRFVVVSSSEKRNEKQAHDLGFEE